MALISIAWAGHITSRISSPKRKNTFEGGRSRWPRSHHPEPSWRCVSQARSERACRRPPRCSLAEWQKAAPADYETEKVNEIDAQLKTLKKRLAQKSSPDSVKPQ